MSYIYRLIKAKKKAEREKNLKEVANICNQLGAEFQEVRDYDSALAQHQEEAGIFQALDDPLGIAVAHRRMGEVYSEMGLWDKALVHQKKHLHLAKEIGSFIEQQRAYATIGRTHYQRAEAAAAEELITEKLEALKESEKAYRQSLGTFDNLHAVVDSKELSLMRCRLYHNIGLVLDMKDKTLDAIRFVSQALELCQQYGLHEDAYRSYSELARMHLHIGTIQKAVEECQLSLAMAIKLQNKSYIVDSYFLIAQAHINNNDFDAAKKSYYKAYKIKHPVKDVRENTEKNLKLAVHLCLCIEALGKPDISMEDNLKYLEKLGDGCAKLGLYKQAIVYYEKTLENALKINKEETYLASIYISLAQTYKDNKQLKEALEYFEKELAIQENRNPEEAVTTLIAMGQISNTLSEDYSAPKSFFDRALKITCESFNSKLKVHVIKSHLSLPKLPADEKERLEGLLEESGNLNTDSELSETEENENSEENEIDLDLIDFSDSDEEQQSSGRPLRGKSSRSVNLKRTAAGETALHTACINGNLALVKKLLDQKHAVNVRDYSGWLPIHEACNWGYFEIAEALLDAGAWINDRGGKECHGTTPLHDAAVNGHFDIVRLLINRGASVLVKDDYGDTPLDSLIKYSTQTGLSQNDISDCQHLKNVLIEMMEKAGCKVPESIKCAINKKISGQNSNKNAKKDESSDEKFSEENSLSLSPLGDNYVTENEGHFSVLYHLKDSNKETKSSATEIYKNAIKYVGSHKKNVDYLGPTNSKSYDGNISSLIPEDNYVTEDWLIDDLDVSTKKRKRSDKLEFEYKENCKKNSRTDFPVRKSKQSKLSNFVRKSSESSYNNDETELFSGYPIQSDGSNDATILSSKSGRVYPETKPFPIAVDVPQVSPLRLQVKVLNKKLLVPIAHNAQQHTIGWLEEEVSRRYQQHAGVKLQLRLNTVNDEVLNQNDTIKMVLSSDNNELHASVIGLQDLPSLPERYSQTCQQQGLPPLPDVIAILRDSESSGLIDFSKSYLRKVFQPIMLSFQHQNVQILNLSSCRIEDAGMTILLESLSTLPMLQKLEMEACSLSTDSLEALCNALQNELVDNKKLSHINLSFNDFANAKLSHMLTLLSFPTLSVLKLQSCGMILSDFQTNKFSSNVQFLELDNNKLGLCAIACITSSCSNLIQFSISHCISPHQRLSNSVYEGTPNSLRENSPQITSIGAALSSLMGGGSECLLEILDISHCDMSDNDLEIVTSFIYRCNSIVSVNVAFNPRLTSSSLMKFLKELLDNFRLPLQALSLHGIKAFTTEVELVSCLNKIIKVKSTTVKPLTKITIPDSSFVQEVIEEWENIYREKALVRKVFQDIFLSLR